MEAIITKVITETIGIMTTLIAKKLYFETSRICSAVEGVCYCTNCLFIKGLTKLNGLIVEERHCYRLHISSEDYCQSFLYTSDIS